MMGNQEARERRIQIFENTLQECERNQRLMQAIQKSREHTECIEQPYLINLDDMEERYTSECEIIVSRDRTLEAAGKLRDLYPDSRIAILNFASAWNPGGGVWQGSSAQEESICRCTTLYPCLNTEKLMQEYYEVHRSQKNAIYSDRCIYTPGVIQLKEDTQWPVLLKEQQWVQVDVISCAAPNRYRMPGEIEERELQAVLEQRVDGIFKVAKSKGIDILVLGAFGCGAFGNSPDMVANSFAKAISSYRHAFEVVNFAIYCTSQESHNYDAFSRILADV